MFAAGSIRDGVPAEFALLLACSRWPPQPESIAALAAGAEIDWSLVLRMARRHRVEGLVSRALGRSQVGVPAECAQPLAAAAAQIAAGNLAAAAEMARLSDAFAEAGVPLLFVKGLSLGALAYNTILLKAGWDVDLLVAPDQLDEAAALLDRCGYRTLRPAGPLSAGRLRRWHAAAKESVWHNPALGITVELHTALADQPALLPGIGLESPQQLVEIAPGIVVPTLAPDLLFAYLTVHGASSAWFRLKWLADLAALLGGADAAEITRLYRRSQELGAGRAAAIALLLCEDLFELPLAPGLRDALRADRVNLWMILAVRRSLAGRAIATELGGLRAGTLWIHLLQLGLRPGLAYKIGELRRQLGLLARLGPNALRTPARS